MCGCKRDQKLITWLVKYIILRLSQQNQTITIQRM